MTENRKKTQNVRKLATICMSVAVVLVIGIHFNSPLQMADACSHCWHVTPGETYPAQFNDNDIGQVVKMMCTVLSNDGKGHITTDCLEQ
jgi:hypothetical protein